jgi:hypothetical protein
MGLHDDGKTGGTLNSLKMLPFVVFATVLALFLIPLLIARPATLEKS